MPTITITRFRDFGAVIKAARESRGLRQDKLADELDITRQYLQDLENGRPNLYITRLLRAMNFLGITISVSYTPVSVAKPGAAVASTNETSPSAAMTDD
ncbi:helix-turn-helix transcriptional regulator [Rhodoglobus aureus]|uniref:HTH cro/C1-type domain-containing protein n=1 Tax=Rhodoglobus aureus TaxID=191497 RepID=A0ABP4G2A3_9MICO